MLNITKEVAAMERITVDQLRGKFTEVFSEPKRSRHKDWLIKRIAWRMQANAEGGLSERALRRALELANDADLRVTAPRERKPSPGSDERTKSITATIKPRTALLPGTALQREYKGHTVRVTVLTEGFEFEGERYKPLTAVAKVVTGQHWNGYHFFNLRQNGGKQ